MPKETRLNQSSDLTSPSELHHGVTVKSLLTSKGQNQTNESILTLNYHGYGVLRTLALIFLYENYLKLNSFLPSGYN